MAMSSAKAMAVSLFVSTASVAWSAAFAWSRWLTRPQQPPHVTTPEHEDRIEERLVRIEHAVQAIAVEVERLGEGQRFTSRLLAERTPADNAVPRLAPEYPRVNTPH